MGTALAEREGAMSALEEVLEHAVAGRGRALFVLGEAGLGKTTLLDHAVRLAAHRLAVGVGRADIAEAALPFGLLNQALEPLVGRDALTGGDGSAPQPAPTRLYTILHRLREVAVRPMLVALDDAQWADPDSLTLLRLICRRLGSMPVAVLVTARPWPPETDRAAEELAGEGLADLERLAPLSRPAASAILTERVGHLAAPADIESAVASCAGNPLLLDHVAIELEAGQSLPELGGRQGGSWASRLLLSRLVGTGHAAEAYLRAASVLGRRFRPEVAAETAGLTPTEAVRAQEEVSRAGLVVDGGDGWAQFSHHLIALAIYDRAAPMRAHLHQAAFHALLGRRAPVGEAAEHAALARLADPVALGTLAQAGRDALRHGAPGTARRHLEAALELGGDANSPEVLLDLANALRALGDNAAARIVSERLLERSELPVGVRLAALSELTQAQFRLGEVERAAATIQEAVERVEAEPPDVAAIVLIDHAHLSLLRSGPAAALPLAARARAVAAAVGGPTRVLADAIWGECAYLSGDPSGLDVAEAAADEARLRAIPTPDNWSRPEVFYAEIATWSERFDQAEHILLEAIGDAERNRNPMTVFEAQFFLMEVLCRTGRLDEANVLSDQLLESAELMTYSLPLAIAQKTLVLTELGELDEASRCCERLDEAVSGRPGLGRAWAQAHHRRAVVALRRGDIEMAAHLFGQLEKSSRRVALLEPSIFPWAAPAIQTYLALRRDEDASRVIEWLEPRAAALPARWPKAVVAGGRAGLAERRDDLETAEAAFAQAVALHDERMPLARAEALTDQGSFLLRRGEAARARPVFAEALRLSEGCGAAWHAERARVGWRRAGGRLGTTPAGELTPQEQAVADLARAGRTNREIAQQLYLSVNTVQTHLAHVYRKLGITRRWQLIAGEQPTTHG
ncbi:MAG TPA: AAA family ATPase [Acidimicrobiales bacterium]|nr:AAA family ATPase [Acidimicrobiales bacterium]